ncbi:hypothetical protein CAPTEDRAFT_130025, partial [Capitella teleta]
QEGCRHSYCRNPSNDPNGPWCFTTDPDVTHEYCDVKFCASYDCRTSGYGVEYRGSLQYTPSGVICQRWDKQSPHSHEFFASNKWNSYGGRYGHENYCRNPSPPAAEGPWCYTMASSTRYAYCKNIPVCPRGESLLNSYASTC